ncbi:hypothetical protein N9528_02025 [Crocinitomicaceae bacterium]|nr:hypothetical protein [Crocinitomicaceae bacterium]
MQKVLIISYFFPPSNFVGGDRTYAWAQHLYESGIYPIIITRNWNENQKDLVDQLDSNEYSIEKTDKYEIHRMPYKRSLRDQLSNYKWLSVFQKALTLKELIFSNFFIKSLPYYNFYSEAKKMIQADSEIKVIIASGRPFQSFFIGYRLKKTFPAINWVPDYRDEWATRTTNNSKGLISGIINQIEQRSEKKWTSNADFFISVSDEWVKNISMFIKLNGHVIMNGFEGKLQSTIKTEKTSTLTFIYIGTLYTYQPIEFFIDSILELPEKTKKTLKVYFIGTSAKDKATPRLKKLTKSNPNLFELIPRISKVNLDFFVLKSDIALTTPYKSLKGCIPVKVFDYFVSGTPILLAPSDNDIQESFIQETNSGYIVSEKKDLKILITEWSIQKRNHNEIKYQPDLLIGQRYSRKNQTKKLAELINKHC